MARASSSLPVPGLALNEDGGIGGGDGFNLPEHPAQALAFADDIVEAPLEVDFFFEVLLFLAKAVAEVRIWRKATALLTAMATWSAISTSVSASRWEKVDSSRLAIIMVPMTSPRWISGTQQPECMPMDVRCWIVSGSKGESSMRSRRTGSRVRKACPAGEFSMGRRTSLRWVPCSSALRKFATSWPVVGS